MAKSALVEAGNISIDVCDTLERIRVSHGLIRTPAWGAACRISERLATCEPFMSIVESGRRSGKTTAAAAVTAAILNHAPGTWTVGLCSREHYSARDQVCGMMTSLNFLGSKRSDGIEDMCGFITCVTPQEAISRGCTIVIGDDVRREDVDAAVNLTACERNMPSCFLFHA